VELSGDQVLAGLLDLALVLDIRASAVLMTGLNPDQAHLTAIPVTDDRVAGQPARREDRAIVNQLLCFRGPLCQGVDLRRRSHHGGFFLNLPNARCQTTVRIDE
jgi:hypothetical protein